MLDISSFAARATAAPQPVATALPAAVSNPTCAVTAEPIAASFPSALNTSAGATNATGIMLQCVECVQRAMLSRAAIHSHPAPTRCIPDLDAVECLLSARHRFLCKPVHRRQLGRW